MSFCRINGYGDTAEEAFVYAKINEIGYNSNPSFLKKTMVMLIENRTKLELNLFMSYNLFNKKLDREPTKAETEALQTLKTDYGEKKLESIFKVYNNPDSETVICFKEDNNFGKFKFMYRFLY